MVTFFQSIGIVFSAVLLIVITLALQIRVIVYSDIIILN